MKALVTIAVSLARFRSLQPARRSASDSLLDAPGYNAHLSFAPNLFNKDGLPALIFRAGR